VWSAAVRISSRIRWQISLVAVAVSLLLLSIAGCAQTVSVSSPAISPASGTYHTAQAVTISNAVAGATVYYTTDGSTPTPSSPVYSGSFSVSNNTTVQAVAVTSSALQSAVASAKYLFPAATVYYSPAAGTYLTPQSISISSRTAGSTIYYTTDGTTPTTASNVYTGLVPVSANTTLTAIAVAAGYTNSFPNAATYTITPPAATPVFSVASGQYTSVQMLVMTDATPGAVIYYTTNGSTPTTASAIYAGPITVGASETIAAVALASGGTLSPVASASYTITLPAATPVISPGTGTFGTAQTVTISDSTPHAVIYYTVNGSAPSTSSSVYSGPISVSSNSTVQAIATASSYSQSALASVSYSFPAATPAIAPAGGTYVSNQTVSLSTSTPGAAIYYTTNGSTPNTSSTLYSAPFTVSSNETVEAMAAAANFNNSPVASATYTITPPAAMPVFSVTAGQYTTVQSVAISDATPGAAIYYTTNGSTPTTASSLYTGAISVGATQTIQAVALAAGGSLSPVASAAYVVILPTATPVISPAGGTFASAQSVTLSDSTPNAVLYYTTNGSTPTTASAVYSGPISVSNNTTIQAIALATSYSTSPTAAATYAFPAATPVITPAAGTYINNQTVSISSSTPGAAVYYTTNGSTPTTTSTLYAGPITVSSNQTVQAIAVATGFNNSSIASSTYTITPPTAAPTFSLAAGSYKQVETITISCTNSSAVIYYTTDGSTPTTASAVYASPLTFYSTQTLSAMALAPGDSNSPITTAAYTIVAPAGTPTFSPGAAKYTSVQSVTIAETTPNAAIHYTTDGTTPTTSSALYTGPITVGATETVQAVALASGGTISSVGKSAYTILLPAASVTFSPAPGTYAAAQTVTLSDATPNAVIYYTVNGNAPNSSSTVYSAPIPLSTNSTIQAIAIATGGSASPTASGAYAFPVATPVITPAAGTYTTSQTVSIASATSGASIYFTTNGTTPSSSSSFYSAPITVSSTETVQAIAIEKNYNNSGVASSAYTITLPTPAPSFSLAAGTYLKTQSVTITCSTKSATIYYTTDGSTPTTSSAVYSAPISVGANETLSAIALAAGGSNSPVTTATYIITLPAATPVASPAAGKYTSVQTVTLTDATQGAAIYYTTDGSTPTTSSAVYSAPINVAATQTIQAIALASGGSVSPMASSAYTITLPTAIPLIYPTSGTYNSIQQVTICDATPGAVIYYTVNGSYPTTASPVYSGPITATTNTTIQAIAIAPAGSASAEATTQYSIVVPAPIVTPSAGTFDYTATVTMSSPVAGAVIYYTTDGTTPTTSSPVYTAPIALSPTKTTVENFQAMAVASGYLQSTLTISSFTITLQSGTLAQATVGSTPVRVIPPNFMGLSADYLTPSTLMGQASSGVNQIYRNLLGNLTQYYTAPLLFRIEGDNSTLAGIQADTEPLVEFAQALNVNYTLGVDLMTDNLSLTESEASTWVNGIPANLIQAIEIGNEPDNYPSQNMRPSTYTFSNYQAEIQEWQQGIQSTIGGNVNIMGPSVAGSSWDAGMEGAISSATLTPTIVSQHAYLSGAAAGQTLPPDYLLQPTSATKLPGMYAPFAAVAHQNGLIFRMGEMNSIGGGGAAGISNSFSSALWSIDTMFNFLNNGMDGVNWHSGQYTAYELFQFKPICYKGNTTFSLTLVNPVYYGLLTFAQMAGRNASLLPVSTISDANVSIWATIDGNGTTHMIVINKDEAATGNVQINLPGYTTGTVRYLSAPSYTSTVGVTLGGQTFDGSTDGTIQGQVVTSTITGQNGVFTLSNMPTTTAALIDFTE